MAVRPEKGSFYDFTCGNDFRRVKLAIKSNTYHAVKVSAEIAQSINFTGGLARIDEILLYKCFKLTRVMWPEACGFINIFKIHEADSLGRLDISPLHELQQLSIQNCHELEDLSGITKNIKSIMVIGSKLNHLSLSHFNHLENIIIFTSAPVFTLNIDHCDVLRSVSIVGKNITAKASHCKNLKTLHIGANDSKAIVGIDNCPAMAEAFIICNKQSEITGLAECLRLNYLMLPDYEKILTDITRPKLINNIEAFNKAHHVKESIDDVIQDFNHFVNECRKNNTILLSGHSDVETIVQENSTIRESKRTCSVMIQLLSLLQAYHKPELNKYYGGFMGKHMDEPGSVHLPSGGMLAAAVANYKQSSEKRMAAHFMQSSLSLKDSKGQYAGHAKNNNKEQLKQVMPSVKQQMMKIHHWLHEHGQDADIKQEELQELVEEFEEAVAEVVHPEPEAYESFHAEGAGEGVAYAYAPSMGNMFRPTPDQLDVSPLRNSAQNNFSRSNPSQNQSQPAAHNQFVQTPANVPKPAGGLKADPSLIPIADKEDLSNISAQAKSAQALRNKPGPLNADPSLIPYSDDMDEKPIAGEDKADPERLNPAVLNVNKPGEIEGVLSVNKPEEIEGVLSVNKPEEIEGVLSVNKPEEIEGVLSVNKPEEIEGVLSVNKPEEIEGVLSVNKPEEIEGVLSVDKPEEIEGKLSAKKPDFLLAARGFADAINLLSDAARGVVNEESSDHLLEMEHKTITLFKRQLPTREAPSGESLLAVARKLTDALNDLREACVFEKRSDQDEAAPRVDKKDT